MNNVSNWPVVAKRHQMQARCVSRVPRTQRGRRFVRKQNIILTVIENSLRVVLLFARRARTCVRNQTTTRAQFPQSDQ